MSAIHVVAGSKSDLGIIKESGLLGVLKYVDATFEVSVCSAHRNSSELAEFVENACQNGAKVFIGVAGMAAALPGALAACTEMAKPIIAVPLDEHGVDSCLYMPPGVPVLTTGVGKTGLKNAGIAAAQVMATGRDDIESKLREFVERNNKQPEFNIDLEED